MNTSLPTTTYYEYLYEISDGQTPTKLMYGWSKWGGASKGMVQGKNPYWYCQSCRNEFPEEIESFMFPIFDREFGRMCQGCLDEAILKRIKNLWQMMEMHKVKHGIFD